MSTHHSSASQIISPTRTFDRFFLVGACALVAFLAWKWVAGSVQVTTSTSSPSDPTQIAISQIPFLKSFNSSDLPKKKVLARDISSNEHLLGFAELGMNDDVTISLTCVRVTNEKATLIKKIVPGLHKDEKIRTLTTSQIDLATCDPLDKSLGSIPAYIEK
jgi:hypothetical protein